MKEGKKGGRRSGREEGERGEGKEAERERKEREERKIVSSDMRVGSEGRLSTKDLMLLNCGAGEDS